MPIDDKEKAFINEIMDDARLCSYSYMSKRNMKFTDCLILNNCKNYPNGCVSCDVIVRLDLMRRMVKAITHGVEEE